jgi:hypothetical protein
LPVVFIIVVIPKVYSNTHIVVVFSTASLYVRLPVGDTCADVDKFVEVVLEILLVALKQLLDPFLLLESLIPKETSNTGQREVEAYCKFSLYTVYSIKSKLTMISCTTSLRIACLDE